MNLSPQRRRPLKSERPQNGNAQERSGQNDRHSRNQKPFFTLLSHFAQTLPCLSCVRACARALLAALERQPFVSVRAQCRSSRMLMWRMTYRPQTVSKSENETNVAPPRHRRAHIRQTVTTATTMTTTMMRTSETPTRATRPTTPRTNLDTAEVAGEEESILGSRRLQWEHIRVAATVDKPRPRQWCYGVPLSENRRGPIPMGRERPWCRVPPPAPRKYSAVFLEARSNSATSC